MLSEEMKELIEYNGWTVTEDGNTTTFQQYSPAGKDFIFELEDCADDTILDDLYKYYQEYDVSYETYIWLDSTGHGTNGAPDELEDVLNDVKWCENAMYELYQTLSAAKA